MKILIVDDNVFVQEVTKSFLVEDGHDISLCSNVDDAIAELEQNDFDLLITDIVMPEKTGIDLMEHVRAQKIEIPVLAITGGVENAIGDYVAYANLFADKSLAKPLGKEELISSVRELTTV